MIKKVKVSYYFEKQDRKEFKKWLVDNDLTQQDFAKICGVSVSFINSLIFGKRPITQHTIKVFGDNGYKII